MNYSRRQLEALGETLGECVTRKEGGRVIYGGGGSGGGSAPASQTQISDLPEWAKPYAKQTLGLAEALTTTKDAGGNVIGPAKYQTYGGERIAGFQPIQQKAQEAAYNMGTAGQLGTGTGLATAAGLMGLGASYQPGVFRNQFRAPEAYQPSQFAMLQAEAPELQQFQMGPAERVYGGQYGAPMMETAQTGYRPDLQMFQMAGPERVRTGSFTRPGTAAQYMSPYIEQALAPQLREAQRASDILGTQQAGQAVQQGAFGGSRAALLEAERQRNLATQMGDIRARGLQSAYEQAQQLYGTEAQRQLAAQQANQQAMLQAGGQNLQAALGVQQLGTQTGLQTALANLSAQQQANVQNQAAQLQAQGLTAQQAMQAALANQQAGLTTGQQNLAALLGVQQLGAGQSMQAQLANQQALQAAQQAAEQSRQFGYGQGMTAAQQRAQFGQAAQQLGEQSRQYGAGYGLQGLGTALQAAGQLGQLGQTEFGQAMDINRLQQQVGAQQQALEQQRLSQSYQDFMNQQRYPYQQLEFMSNILRGTPMGTVQTMYQPGPSAVQNIASLGLGAYGLKQLGMFADGGQVSGYARGGSVTDEGNVKRIVSDLSDTQLAQAKQAAMANKDMARLKAIAEEEATRASERRGMASIYNLLPSSVQNRMAGGGIVAFADEGLVEDDDDEGGSESAGGAGEYVRTPGGLFVHESDLEGGGLETPSPGSPTMHALAAQRALRYGQQIGRFQPTVLTPEQERAYIKGRFEQEQALAGPNEAAKTMRAYLSEADVARNKSLEQAKGLSALRAASAILRPGGTMRGLGAAGEAFAESYDKALQADRAEKRALKMAQINLMDAERKEKLGFTKSAMSSLAAHRQNLQKADQLGLNKLRYQQEGAAAVARATRPTAQPKPTAPRAPKEFEFAMDTYLPAVKELYPDLTPAQQRAKALRMYQEGRSAGLAGVETRVEATAEEGARTRAQRRTLTDPQFQEAVRKKDTAAQATRRAEILAEEMKKPSSNAGAGVPGAAPVLKWDPKTGTWK